MGSWRAGALGEWGHVRVDIHNAGQVKIGQFGLAEENVVAGQVSVDDAIGVEVGHARCACVPRVNER